jgi:hypothetical protein
MSNYSHDPVAEAYAEAIESGDYETALAISVGAQQHITQNVQEQAFLAGYETAAQISKPPRDEEELQKTYTDFLAERDAAPEQKTPERKAADAIVRAAREDDINYKLDKALGRIQ